ncbi:TfuA-like protein [Dongia rigui]|uniref:TfuA-like protein n=1 Tax=Dongia rigui TaxID=940149 RepID=A0ABU5DZE8_9PROT|nr:TfuA-like protein [Dongia rigui]MDY0872693.1 TfuA-like protein [Dongia rigui]
MTPIVFAGPSLHGIASERLAGIDLRPPAGKGDLLAAVQAGGQAIGVIDGSFEYGASVWHKEILFALRRGVAVFGAASMGALRAAECAAFGMVGIGRVFADYEAGRRRSDGDVAMVHAPAALGYKPLTEALVDMDETLARLLATAKIDADIAGRLGAAASALHFKDRTWPQVLAAAGIDGAAKDDLTALLRAHRVSIKTEDALALIDHMRALPAARATPPAFDFNETLFFREMMTASARRP